MRKYALITGASGGIGAAVASKLAEEGYSLYLHYHQNNEAIEALRIKLKAFGGEYIPIQADLSSPQGYKKVEMNVFSLDAVIHNSGTGHYGLLVDIDEREVDQLILLHVRAPLLLTKALLPKLIQKQSGSVVVISSIWGQTGAAMEVAYSAAKGAQIAFVKALSKEMAPSGIRVNAIAPGAIQTPMLAGFTSEDIKAIQEEIPLGRLGCPEEIADSVSFLLSDKASYITGQVLAVNGGWYV